MTFVWRLLWPLLLGVSWACRLQAQPSCGAEERPWVAVDFSSNTQGETFQQVVLEDLRAGLTNRRIDACRKENGPRHAPIAEVMISPTDPSRIGVTVDVRDSVTRKRVSRDLDLSGVPADGRPLAVAIAADELIWATWAELALDRPGKPKEAAPPEVVDGVEREIPSRSASHAPRIGIAAAGEHFLGGLTQLGVDARFLIRWRGGWGFDVNGGLRSALADRSEHGRVLAHSAGAGTRVRYGVITHRDYELDVGIGGHAFWVALSGEADSRAEAAETQGAVILLAASPVAAVRLGGPLWFEWSASVGYTVRGLEATDTGRVVTGATGMSLGSTLGFVVAM